jgi:nitrite reductase/ring-hydroxylating ferredoxin subunit
MAELFVGKHADLKDGDVRIVRGDGFEVGVYRRAGAYYAYRNQCPHQGGPACEGKIMGKVEDIIARDRTHQGQRFNDDEPHIVCPWHGWEFRLLTGECAADPKLKLRRYEVTQKEGEVYVVV